MKTLLFQNYFSFFNYKVYKNYRVGPGEWRKSLPLLTEYQMSRSQKRYMYPFFGIWCADNGTSWEGWAGQSPGIWGEQSCNTVWLKITCYQQLNTQDAPLMRILSLPFYWPGHAQFLSFTGSLSHRIPLGCLGNTRVSPFSGIFNILPSNYFLFSLTILFVYITSSNAFRISAKTSLVHLAAVSCSSTRIPSSSSQLSSLNVVFLFFSLCSVIQQSYYSMYLCANNYLFAEREVDVRDREKWNFCSQANIYQNAIIITTTDYVVVAGTPGLTHLLPTDIRVLFHIPCPLLLEEAGRLGLTNGLWADVACEPSSWKYLSVRNDNPLSSSCLSFSWKLWI